MFVELPAEYPQFSVSYDPDDSRVDILADIFVDELVALDDEDQAEQTGQYRSQASEEEVLEIGPKPSFIYFFHG